MVWRVYCEGREFGIDYMTLARARVAKSAYVTSFPSLRYYVRRAR